MTRGRPADNPPKIIQVLAVIADRVHTTSAELKAAYATVDEIVAQWEDSEDIEQLQNLLGVGKRRKKRRKQQTFDTEIAMTMELYDAVLKGDERPKETVADLFEVDVRTVERAWHDWGEQPRALMRRFVALERVGSAAAARWIEVLEKLELLTVRDKKSKVPVVTRRK